MIINYTCISWLPESLDLRKNLFGDKLASSSDVVSERIEWKYKVTSGVNVDNFISWKLSINTSSKTYKIWKAQMLCLIESQELLHMIINDDHPTTVVEIVDEDVDMISRFDKLVKGWILSSLDESIRRYVVEGLGTAQEVWMKLESTFDTDTDIDTEGDTTREREKYNETVRLDVSEFVSTKLSGHNNYHIWKAQMLNLIEREKLLHIIIAKYPFPEDKGVHMISKYEKLVKGWIFATMDHQLVENFIDNSWVQTIWRKLESTFNQPISDKEGDSAEVSAIRDDLKYIQVSNVNVSNFVTVPLSGHNNYNIWSAQMKCLLRSQDLLHITEVKTNWSYGLNTEKYDNLVKGWIFGTVNYELLGTFREYHSVQFIWHELQSKFESRDMDPDLEDKKEEEDLPRFKFRTESEIDVPEMQNIKNKLHDAAVEGCWWKAKSILEIHKKAATEAITENGNRILHLAVQTGHNYFVEKLLEFLKFGPDIETKNKLGQTALHIAAIVGNTQAAQLLLKKRKELLWILDNNNLPPVGCSIVNTKIDVSTYLLKSILSPDFIDDLKEYYVANLILGAIFIKRYDLARKVLEKFPQAAIKDGGILKLITISFPTDLGFTESIIYPSFHDVLHKIIVRGSLLCHSNILEKCVEDILRVVKICNNMCFSWLGRSSIIFLVPIATLYPIYQFICLLILVLCVPFSLLYFLVWKVFAVSVPPIKNIEEKKIEYIEAKKTLSLICDQMGTSNKGYRDSMVEAVRQGTYEVVDEILFRSPSAINYKDEKGYNIIQLVVICRSEKVYNLIYHIIESNRRMTDSSNNNLLHLVGKLAPSFVLDRTTGAALQLQRELLWRAEVHKLQHPLELTFENDYKETPTMVFTREHKDLVKQGETWCKTTAESCSITAALIITVVFAAAITVPGGSNQSGIPTFENETAFTVFAISNAASLFTATAALLLFLSILTTRFSERDFLVSLPRRLIFGLSMLFLSTTSMIVAFCAILLLVFCDQRPWMLAPICVLACLPISVIVTIKLPLLVDLIRSTYFPIFGMQSYLETCKINRKNTIFMKYGDAY